MTGSFAKHTAIHGDGAAHTATLDRSFEIWGPNGGYLSAIALRAAGQAVPDDHRPISMSVQYIGRAAFGSVTVAVEPIKTGSVALTFVSLSQEDKLFLAAQIWSTSRSEGPAMLAAAMPDVPPPDALEPLGDHLARAGIAENPFWHHFDVRPVAFRTGRNPDGPRLRQWFRYRDFPADADPFLDAGRGVLLIDTLIWPAHNRGLDANAEYLAPTTDLSVWFHGPAHSDWLLLDVAAEVAGGGLIQGGARIWTPDGRLVASGGSGLVVLPPRR